MSRYATTLRLAAKLIEREENWLVGMLAGFRARYTTMRVLPTDPRATCFCVEGAVCNVLGVAGYTEASVPAVIIDALHEEGCRILAKHRSANGGYPYAKELQRARDHGLPTATPYAVNDVLGHAAVLELLERAARRLELYQYGREAA